MTALARVEAALEVAGSQRKGRSWTCPAHEDRSPSLEVKNGDGKCTVKCHAGCSIEDVLGRIGLRVADLYDEPHQPNGTATASRRITVEYDYLGRDGQVAFQVVRLEPKDFRQRRPDGHGGWHWNLKGVDRVLSLPESPSDLPMRRWAGRPGYAASCGRRWSAAPRAEGPMTGARPRIVALPPCADKYSLMGRKTVRVEPLTDADETAQAASRTYW